jgi:hypothetical protein
LPCVTSDDIHFIVGRLDSLSPHRSRGPGGRPPLGPHGAAGLWVPSIGGDKKRCRVAGARPIIAEGCGRSGDREFARFLSIAAGPASESEYQLLLTKDLTYLVPHIHHELDEQVNGIKRMLNAFIEILKPG